jgi:Spy/CpxP family protein refolding chaperone
MPDADNLRKAGATEQQVQAFEEFMFDQQAKHIDLRAAAEKAELALNRLMKASNPDEKAVMQAVDARNQAQGELFKADVAARLKVKQILGEGILRKLQEQGMPARMDGRADGPGGDRPDLPRRDAGSRPPLPPDPRP